MKSVMLMFSSLLVLVFMTGCNQQTEPTPDTSQQLTLRPGQTRQVKVNDATYTITYDRTDVEFKEGVGEGNTVNFYVRGQIKLVINNEPVSLRGSGSYNDKGVRRSTPWTYMKDSELTQTFGGITLGATKMYPASNDPSINANYTIELLIQRQ
ncbi:MAG: hypothetical protein H7Z72_01930 [Bacteroidetes bacterium]|nr:hypothetical protein [Fibrella sp.]